MTPDKAREFFSAYYEGTLEPGLVASLERSLRADVGLRLEYDAFVATVESLDALRHEAIPIPAYLGDRIGGRIHAALDAKRVPFWRALLSPRAASPSYGWALGVAGALLVASVALRGLDARGAGTASVLPGGADAVRWSGEGSQAVATFAGGAAKRIAVSPEGGAPTEYRLAVGQPLELTLSNPNAASRRFEVSLGDETLATVAVPGTRLSARRTGAGSVAALAGALADAYHVTVVVKGIPVESTFRWSFDTSDARVAAERSLAGHAGASMMEGNILQIGQ